MSIAEAAEAKGEGSTTKPRPPNTVIDIFAKESGNYLGKECVYTSHSLLVYLITSYPLSYLLLVYHSHSPCLD